MDISHRFKSYLLITLFLLCLLGISACTDDLRTTEGVTEGQPVTVALSLPMGDFPEENILRAAIDPAREKKVWDLYVLIFDTKGSVVSRHFFPYDEATDGPAGSSTDGEVQLKTTSGIRTFRIIANIDTHSPLADIGRAKLDNVSSLAEMDNLIISAQSGINIISRIGGKLLMSGKASNLTLSPGGNRVRIPLHRVSSKIKFTVTSGDANLQFTPEAWRVMRVPRAVRLVASEDDKTGVPGDANYSDTDWTEFEPDGTSAQTFTYYQYENKKAPKRNIPGTGNEAYYLREKQDKIPNGDGTVTNSAFTYADANATYVQIKGSIAIENGRTHTTASVVYTIHLGYIGGNANDFDCRRNTYYNYTVTITGVNSIVVEATATSADTEPNTGAEGNVLSGIIATFDSHYAACILYLPPATASQPEPFYVNTPFDRHGTTDIDWIKFYVNPKGAAYRRIAVYPGENSPLLLNATQLMHAIRTNPDQFAKDERGNCVVTVFINEYHYEKNPMIPGAPTDKDLWRKFVNQPPREIVFAGKYSRSKDGKSSAISSAIVVRQESIKTAYDTKTSLSAAGFEVMNESWGETYPDETGLNKGNNDMLDGWANSVKDWQQVSSGDDPRTTWYSQAGYNKWICFVKLDEVVALNNYGWGTYKLDADNSQRSYSLTDNKARFACMSRNRDLNGDGWITRDEIRWYMPAVEQMVNIWIGAAGLPIQHQLYRESSYYASLGRPSRVLYLTSTEAKSGRSNPYVIWANEGSSISSLKDAISWSGMQRNQYYTRCVRNLGTDNPWTQPSRFIDWDPTTHIISLVSPALFAQVISSAYRDTDENFLRGELPRHYFKSVYNKPAMRFKVARDYIWGSRDFTWSELCAGKPAKGCKDYYEKADQSDRGIWRLPNQRELALMNRRKVIGSWRGGRHDASRISVWSITEHMDGRAYGGDNVATFLSRKNEQRKARCVRDMRTGER